MPSAEKGSGDIPERWPRRQRVYGSSQGHQRADHVYISESGTGACTRRRRRHHPSCMKVRENHPPLSPVAERHTTTLSLIRSSRKSQHASTASSSSKWPCVKSTTCTIGQSQRGFQPLPPLRRLLDPLFARHTTMPRRTRDRDAQIGVPRARAASGSDHPPRREGIDGPQGHSRTLAQPKAHSADVRGSRTTTAVSRGRRAA